MCIAFSKFVSMIFLLASLVCVLSRDSQCQKFTQFFRKPVISAFKSSKQIYTLSLISLSGLSSVCYKTTQIAGGVRGTGAAPPTSKLRTFLSRPLALSKPIYSNFQINGASGETLKRPDPYFASKIGGLEVSEFLLKLHLFENCCKLAYLEPRVLTKTSPIQKQEGQPQFLPHRLQFG